MFGNIRHHVLRALTVRPLTSLPREGGGEALFPHKNLPLPTADRSVFVLVAEVARKDFPAFILSTATFAWWSHLVLPNTAARYRCRVRLAIQ